MDPDQALNNLITAVLEGDFDQAEMSLSDLKQWHNRDGFAPVDPRALQP